LHHARHEECEHHKRHEETDAESGTRRGIRQHAGTVILSEHHQNAGTYEEPEQAEARPKSAACARRGNLFAVVGAIDIFVGNNDAVGGRRLTIRFGIAEGDGTESGFTPALRRCVSFFHSLTRARNRKRSPEN
jgi:hypothetical protein